MLAIRFSRFGKKKHPLYRIIVNEKHKDPWCDYKEKLGHYNPHTKELQVNEERVKFYVGNGADVSNSVWNLLVEKGVLEGKKRNVSHINKKRKEKLAEAKAAEEEAKKEAEEKAAQEAEAAKAEQEAPAEQPTEEAPAEATEEKNEESSEEESK